MGSTIELAAHLSLAAKRDNNCFSGGFLAVLMPIFMASCSILAQFEFASMLESSVSEIGAD